MNIRKQEKMLGQICKRVSEESLLRQLGEECSELSAAIFKYLRKLENDNPTPKTEKEILENLKEEIMDVQLCIDVLPMDLIDYNIYDSKLNRWNERLEVIE